MSVHMCFKIHIYASRLVLRMSDNHLTTLHIHLYTHVYAYAYGYVYNYVYACADANR